MSLLDDLAKARTRKPNLAEWLIARPPVERAAFEAALTDPTVPDESLVLLVRKYGGKTTRTTVQMHRSKHDVA